MRDLVELRGEIDRIDREIVRLYEERMQISSEVADYKIQTGKPVYDPKREQEKLETLTALAHTDFNKCGVRELFQLMMSISRKKQYQLLPETVKEDSDFLSIDRLETEDACVVYQGTEGAYSEQAMKRFFGNACTGFHVKTWRDAMEALKSGKADYAVLPIENSCAGMVSENYDLLAEYDNVIVGEQLLEINHALLGIPDTSIADIQCVYSHPQALMQCGDYLRQHGNWEVFSVKNTAEAAKMVCEAKNPKLAAIASEVNAGLYRLSVIDKNIQDHKDNSTRFVIVGSRKVYAPDADKISISFEVPNESGSLYHMLSHFIFNNLNMSLIQSRPMKKRNWEYRFFIDFDGNLKDSSVLNALRGLRAETLSLKILGNYKRWE